MSILLHVTVRRNLPSIYRRGIDRRLSCGARAGCWFCSSRLREWAIAHVAERHEVPVADVVVIRVNVPRAKLVRRAPASGLAAALSAPSSPWPSPSPPEWLAAPAGPTIGPADIL